MENKHKRFLTVAPFECAWHDDLRFREAGRGCVAFDAFAHNDVTIVFRENAGSQQYHYKRDSSPHYTVIIGSHRNKRFNILVNGKTVVDVSGIDLYCSSKFQSYWISIYDGLISIGKGRYPFQNLVFQWLDSNPIHSVQYVGLSSWDRHVGYRNVNIMPFMQNHLSLWKHVDCGKYNDSEDEDEEMENAGDVDNWELKNFLESWELADVIFIVGKEEKAVPAHKAILAASGNFGLRPSGEDFIHDRDISYPILHAVLEYIYTGSTKVPESHLSMLKDLSSKFQVNTLVKQCEEMMERFKLNKKIFDSGRCVEISYRGLGLNIQSNFLNKLPIDVNTLKHFQATGMYSDVDIYVEGYGQVTKAHKIVLGLWSSPFTKMFTNGMNESLSSKICLKDICFEAFKIMLDFMYGGVVIVKDRMDFDTILLQLLLLADQFGVSQLHQECCKQLLEHLSEDSLCDILRIVSSVPSCKIIEEACVTKFAIHFDYCTTASNDFVMLDRDTFSSILQHPDLTVTSEERVLCAVLLWSCQSEEVFGWQRVNNMLRNSAPELIFGYRLEALYEFLELVRFPLLPLLLLQKLEGSKLCKLIPTFKHLVKEAIHFIESRSMAGVKDTNKFRHRKSSFKELQFICDGDNNGVLYFAGTSYGQHQWVNPVLSKKVFITGSSPVSRFTDPKVLVSRSYQGTSFAGPRMENGKNTAWWMVDIGDDHQLICNYYTIRQDGSRAFLRHWSLQGSTDGANWASLRVHENDATMCKSGQYASWPVVGSNALLPFRFFRIALTG
ncbi:hypothetical protein M569_08953, partial [Genlisea aurea]